MRAAVIQVLKAGYLDSSNLDKKVAEMTADDCARVLGLADPFPEPFTREEQTLWDRLISEAEAED